MSVSVQYIHTSCIAHVVSFGSKDYLQFVEQKIKKDCDRFSTISRFVKRHRSFLQTAEQLGTASQITSLDIKTCRPLTFVKMKRKGFH